MKFLRPAIFWGGVLLISSGLSSSGQSAEVTLHQNPFHGVATRTISSFRWKDIATNTYAQSYKDSYEYAQAIVELSYDATLDSTLHGHLSATSLKPNFAYQMKLAGKPTAIWGLDGDDVTNERLGYLGRWWRIQPNPGNSNDDDYEENHDQPGYIFEGYLIFAFFVTDSTGCAEIDFAISSSYHVLWWEYQRIPGGCDSPVLWSTVIGHADHPAYEEDVGPTSVGIYAEIERNCFGTTTMPTGLYNCCFLLTEESFHQSGEDEGNWQSILIDDNIQFEIADVAVTGSWGVSSLLYTEPLTPNPFLTRTVLKFVLSKSSQVSFLIYDLSGRIVRHYPVNFFQAGGHQIEWDACDDSGRSVASGVYFCRLKAGSHSETKRMVLVK
jgi:hypothetical protein